MSNVFTTGRLSGGRTAFELVGLSYDPTLGELAGAGARQAFEGAGSAIQDVAARDIARELGRESELGFFQGVSEAINTSLFGSLSEDTKQPSGIKISADEWKQSEFFLPTIEYQEGMTTRAAEILYNRAKRQEDRDFLFERATGLVENTAVFVGGFGGAMADAKNVAVSAAVAAATPLVVGSVTAPAAPVVGAGAGILAGAARLTTSLSRLNSAGIATLKASRRARLGAVLGEATLSTIPQITTGLQNAELTQEDYEVGDAALDLVASIGLSAGFWKAGEAVRSAWTRYATPDAMTEVAQLTIRQIELGEKIDVQPLVRAQLADFTPTRLDAPEPSVRQLADGQWEAAVGNQVFVGRTKTDVTAQAREVVLAESLEPLRQMGYSPAALAQIEEALRYKQIVEPELQRRQQIEQSRAQVVANLERTSVMRAQQLSDTLVRVKKERNETQKALSALRKEMREAESKLKSTPSVAGRSKKLASIKAKITNFEKKIFENPEAFAFFDDRVLAAFVRLEKATKLRDKKPSVAREQEVLKAREEYEQALKQVLDNPASIVDFVPEIQVLRNSLTEAAESFRDIQLGQREVRRTRALERLQVQARLAEMEIARRDQFIRQLQQREAVQPMPDFARRQLDNSVEAQAARSVDPEAERIVAERVPAVKFDEDAPPPPMETDVAIRIRSELETSTALTKEQEALKKALAEADAMRDIPTAIENFIKCRTAR